MQNSVVQVEKELRRTTDEHARLREEPPAPKTLARQNKRSHKCVCVCVYVGVAINPVDQLPRGRGPFTIESHTCPRASRVSLR